MSENSDILELIKSNSRSIDNLANIVNTLALSIRDAGQRVTDVEADVKGLIGIVADQKAAREVMQRLWSRLESVEAKLDTLASAIDVKAEKQNLLNDQFKSLRIKLVTTVTIVTGIVSFIVSVGWITVSFLGLLK